MDLRSAASQLTNPAKTANCPSAQPAVLGRDGLELLDFCAEADAAVSVGLVADMHDARGAAHLLGGIPGHFRGHAQRRFDGHTNLQWSRGGEEEPSTRNIQSFRKMLDLVRSNPKGTEAQRCP